MASTPTPAPATWDLSHIVTTVGMAMVGAAVLPVAAPAVLAGLGLTAAAGALGIGVSGATGALLGGWLGHTVAKPSA